MNRHPGVFFIAACLFILGGCGRKANDQSDVLTPADTSETSGETASDEITVGDSHAGDPAGDGDDDRGGLTIDTLKDSPEIVGDAEDPGTPEDADATDLNERDLEIEDLGEQTRMPSLALPSSSSAAFMNGRRCSVERPDWERRPVLVNTVATKRNVGATIAFPARPDAWERPWCLAGRTVGAGNIRIRMVGTRSHWLVAGSCARRTCRRGRTMENRGST